MKKFLIATVSTLALFATPAMASDSRSSIDQIGDGNAASVTQTGAMTADSFIEQNGIRNSATVTQSGNGNVSTIQQKDLVGNNFPDPIVNNVAVVNQTGTTSYSDIQQDGLRNRAEVDMSGIGSDNGIQPPRPTTLQGFRDRQNRESYIEQVGNDNFAKLVQRANFSSSDIRQRPGADDRGSNGNNAQVTQDSSGFQEKSEILQNGDGNNAFVYQNGSNNVSNINQQGDANFADVAQVTNFNVSTIVQTGNNHSATVRQ